HINQQSYPTRRSSDLNELGKDEFEIVVPSVSILAEPPVTVVNKNAEHKGTLNVSNEYLKYLYSKDGQALAAKHYYRPSMPNLVRDRKSTRLNSSHVKN